MTLGAAICWAIYVSLGATVLRRYCPLRATAWTITFGALFLAPFGLVQLATVDSPGRPAQIAGLLYSGLLSSALGNVVVSGASGPRPDPDDELPVPRAGARHRVRGDLPRRADPRHPGRRRRDHRRSGSSLARRDRGGRSPSPWRRHDGRSSGPAAGRGPRRAAAGIAPPIAPLRPGEPPLAILVDYDGTISLSDVGDTVMAEHVPGAWEEMAARYDAGRMGSRRLMELEMGLVDAPDDGAAMRATAAAQAHDPGFVPFVRRALGGRRAGRGRERRLRLLHRDRPREPRRAARSRSSRTGRSSATAGPSSTSPTAIRPVSSAARASGPGSSRHQAAGRAVVFIGDGESDRYAAGYSDVVFAKRALVPICLANGWPFERWTEFAEVDAWLAAVLDAWRPIHDARDMPRPAATRSSAARRRGARASSTRPTDPRRIAADASSVRGCRRPLPVRPRRPDRVPNGTLTRSVGIYRVIWMS